MANQNIGILARLRSMWSAMWQSDRTSGPGEQASTWDGQFDDTYTSRRRQSIALDQLTAGNYACILSAMKRDYKHANEMRPRFIPLVKRWVGDVATHYDRPPRRYFTTALAERQLKPEEFNKLKDVYARSAIDDAMKSALRKVVTQNTVLVVVMPKDIRQVKLHSFCPYEFEVTPGDPLNADDPQKAAEIRLRVPVSNDGDGIQYGKLIMNSLQIYIERDDGSKYNPYNKDVNDLTNQFGGQYPVIDLRGEEPPKGDFAANVDQSLLAEVLSLCLANGSTDHSIKHSGFPTKVIKSTDENAATTKGNYVDTTGMPSGPEHWVGLPIGTEISAVHTQLQVAEFDNHNEQNLKLFAVMRGLPADWFMKVYSNTQSKTLDRHDQAVRRAQYLVALNRAESQLVVWIVRVLNQFDSQRLPDDLDVIVNWSDWLVDAEPETAAAARQAQYRNGEDNPAAYLSRRDNLDPASAEQRVVENLKLTTRLLGALPAAPTGSGPAGG